MSKLFELIEQNKELIDSALDDHLDSLIECLNDCPEGADPKEWEEWEKDLLIDVRKVEEIRTELNKELNRKC